MFLREREILIIDCEVKQVKEEKFINVTFLDLEDGKTYLIKSVDMDLLPILNNKLCKFKVTLELTLAKNGLELSFGSDIENLGRV